MPSYKLYLDLNNIYQKFEKAFSQWIFAPLTTRYIIHALMIIMGSCVLASNIYARESNQDFIPVENKNGILISLITPDFQEYIEETSNYEQLASQTYTEETDYLSSADHAITISVDYLGTIDAITFAKPEIVNTTTNLKLRNQIETYTVEGGDTISGIAEKFGLKMATLLNTNGLTLRSSIKPGQTLSILPIDGLVHTVKSGDTISKLAKTYQAQTQQIKEYNSLADDNLPIGDKLIIPYGVKPAAVVYKPSTTSSSSASGTPTTSQAYDGTVAPGGVSETGTKLQWPASVYVITQYYHMGHLGLDISGANSLGTPLYAAEDGVVTVAQGGWNGGYGIYVKIDHGNGIVTLYGHCSKLYVQPGETVTRGQTIALMGSTGRSTGPHIHFEVIVNGAKANPLNYIR
jgi:murein DD-endopeptidase MepM/ murein hydrolase activator NlpD